MEAVLQAVLAAAPPTPFSSVEAFRVEWHARRGAWPLPVDQAILGGALADRLGYAFAAGYAAALARLVPELGATVACLCVTEAGGAHPRAIQTALTPVGTGFVLTGRKQWATLAGVSDVLLVAASRGRDGDRNDIVLVRVSADTSGVSLLPMPATPFSPEIPHYEVALDAVPVGVDDVLPGDGYARYIKPFRTVEDIHVCAAAVAHLVVVARGAAWPPALVSRLLSLLVGFRTLALADPEDAGVHVALAGSLATLREVLRDCPWESVEPEIAARWHRDAPLLGIAERARVARFERAWKKV